MKNKLLQWFFLSLVAGYVIFTLLGAKREGDEPEIGINFIVYGGDGECYHLHHWILLTASLAMISFFMWGTGANFSAPLYVCFAGFAAGASLQDLQYPNWYIVKQKCPAKK